MAWQILFSDLWLDLIGVRGEPNVLFNPWVRWDTWPGLGREFFRRRRRRRRRRRPSDLMDVDTGGVDTGGRGYYSIL